MRKIAIGEWFFFIFNDQEQKIDPKERIGDHNDARNEILPESDPINARQHCPGPTIQQLLRLKNPRYSVYQAHYDDHLTAITTFIVNDNFFGNSIKQLRHINRTVIGVESSFVLTPPGLIHD